MAVNHSRCLSVIQYKGETAVLNLPHWIFTSVLLEIGCPQRSHQSCGWSNSYGRVIWVWVIWAASGLCHKSRWKEHTYEVEGNWGCSAFQFNHLVWWCTDVVSTELNYFAAPSVDVPPLLYMHTTELMMLDVKGSKIIRDPALKFIRNPNTFTYSSYLHYKSKVFEQ